MKEKRIIKNEYLRLLCEDQVFHAKVSQSVSVHPSTVRRWCMNNDAQLCHVDILDIIKEHLELEGKQVTELVKV